MGESLDGLQVLYRNLVARQGIIPHLYELQIYQQEYNLRMSNKMDKRIGQNQE